jgi:hypothetical protein
MGFHNLFKEGSMFNSMDTWFYAKVVSVNDPFDAHRIKVRIPGIDNVHDNDQKIIDDDTLWVVPFLPKFGNTVPKVGETVKIIIKDPQNPFINREYIGPVISQKENFEFDPHYFTSRAGSSQSLTKLKKPWTQFPDSKIGDWAIFPEKEDIQLHGRGNTDIILRKKENYDEILLRTAKWDFNNKLKVNQKNPTYITINHTRPQKEIGDKKTRETSQDLNLEDDRTHINLVSDNINLITHKDGSKKIPKILSGDIEKQLEVESELHPLVYGDLFWDFVGLMGNFVKSHIHPYSGLPPDPSLSTLELTEWIAQNRGTKIENSKFLSKGVKTN